MFDCAPTTPSTRQLVLVDRSSLYKGKPVKGDGGRLDIVLGRIGLTVLVAAAVGLVLPELNGKLDGFSVRVPTINVSLVDLSFIAARDTTVAEVNDIMKAANRVDASNA